MSVSFFSTPGGFISFLTGALTLNKSSSSPRGEENFLSALGLSVSFLSGLISGFTELDGNNPASGIGNVSFSAGFVSAAFTTLLSSFFPASNRSSSSSRGEVVFDCTGLLGFISDFG